MKIVENLREWGTAVYRRINRRLGGMPEVLINAYRNFALAQAMESAASLAYYALFALFPFLLVLIFVGTLLLGSRRAETELVGLVTQMLPGSQQIVEQNLADIIARRGTVTLVGVVGLVWAASGFFIALTRNLRCAWPEFTGPGLVRQRLTGLGAVLLLGLLLVLWSLANVILNTIPRLFDELLDAAFFSNVFARIIPVILVLPMLAGLYQWTAPRGRHWRGVLVGAAFAAIVLQALILVFGWYLGSGLVNFEVVYGSLGGVIALLLFVYLVSFIVLFGAYLASAVEYRAQKAPVEVSTPIGADLTD